MAVTTELIKTLRAMTGAGMMDVKNTLEETGGDLEKAAALLRERGIAKASKKADRAATEGFVGSYIHHNGKIAVLIEVNCETDFVARNEGFQELARNLAIHIAMANPQFVRREEIPEAVIEAERHALAAEARAEGKSEAIIERMTEGRLKKFYSDICLLDQNYIKDDSKTIDQLVKESIATIGENIQIGRFSRIAIGE